MINRQECLIFYHIPKTAGMTFTNILEKEYGKNHSFHLRRAEHKMGDFERYRSLPLAEKKKINLITGHISHVLEPDVPLKIRYVTFLRDPLSQFISSYNYISQTPHNPHHAEVKKLKGMEEFLDWQVETYRDLSYARYLGDATKYHQREVLGYKVTMQDSDIGEKVFKKAQERLQSIEFVFITEEFDEALLVLRNALGWPITPYYKRRNISEHKAKPNKNLIAKIEDVYKYDFLLYEEAKRRHAQLVKERLGSSAKLKVELFKILNNMYSRHTFPAR